ncbi:MAG TPA: carboxylesterase family protein [Bryobacteraceae bacterium]|nr:carboxylesterase family protein [Bryobacteraceae bacterium]
MRFALLFTLLAASSALTAQQPLRTVTARTAQGLVRGVVSADNRVRTFKGIPFAAPPVGALRWKAPQPAPAWSGIRKAMDYGPRCMQGNIYSDMRFFDAGPSEDCLYLNLWMPEAAFDGREPEQIKLPVMVWIYGGGFQAGSTSEPRQDGGMLSRRGVMVVSFNYRLGVFGFFSHPELAAESQRNASGNYGLMDQAAALRWVHDNIAAFGGDPGNVTIFGESAGSLSVSALMASPLARGLFQRAIGESGAFFGGTLALKPHQETEQEDARWAGEAFGTASLDKLRALAASQVLEASLKQKQLRFAPNVDGQYLSETVAATFARGRQAHVPLLAGWNLDEGSYESFFERQPATLKNYAARAKQKFGDRAAEFLKVYAAATDAEAKRAAADFAGDQFIAYGTWRWIDAHAKTGRAPVYRYRFDQTLPLEAGAPRTAQARAPHSGEIEYVFNVLGSKALPWREEDRKVSDLVATYWTNFAKTGSPNATDLPRWPVYDAGDGYQVMHIAKDATASPDTQRPRYQFYESQSDDE